jgi:hypothetical protein
MLAAPQFEQARKCKHAQTEGTTSPLTKWARSDSI